MSQNLRVVSGLILVIAVQFVGHNAYAFIPDNVVSALNGKAWALANAVTADPPGVDSIVYNPAGLTTIRHEGTTTSWSAGFVFPKVVSPRLEAPVFDLDIVVNGCVGRCLFDEAFEPAIDTETTEVGTYIPLLGVLSFPVSSETADDLANPPEPSERVAAPIPPLPRFAYRPRNSKWVFGTGAYPFLTAGGSQTTTYDFGDNDVAALPNKVGFFFGGIDYISPTVAYEVSDKLSLGLSMGLNAFGMALTLPIRGTSPDYAAPIAALNRIVGDFCEGSPQLATCTGLAEDPLNPFLPILIADVEGEDIISPSHTLGVLWKPLEWLSLGFKYRSAVKHNLKTEVVVEYSQGLAQIVNSIINGEDSALFGAAASLLGVNPINEQRIESFTGNVPIKLPENYALGISLKVTPRLKLNIDRRKYKYSSFGQIVFPLDPEGFAGSLLSLLPDSGPELALPLGGRDVSLTSYGVEYRLNDTYALRAGYENRPTAFSSELFGLIDLGSGSIMRQIGVEIRTSPTTVTSVGFGQLTGAVNVQDLAVEIDIDAYMLLVSFERHQ